MEKRDFTCKNCQCHFETLEACLRHDLIQHICLKRNKGKSTHTGRSSEHWNIFDNKEEEEEERRQVHDVLEKCSPGQELHELFNIYCMDRDTKEELFKRVRSCLLEDLQSMKDLEVEAYGSIDNGLMMKNSDIDIFARTKRPSNTGNNIFYHIIELLRHGKYFDDIIPIAHARVPIIKCRHINTGFKIDINCSCYDSVENTRLIRQIFCYDIRLRTLMRFIKIWAKHHQLVGQGLMTCYCLTSLVLFFLQQKGIVPSIEKMQSEEPPMLISHINYAFDVYKHMGPLAVDLHTRNLLRDFYLYYQKFDFRRLMVATHIGCPVMLDDFKSGKFYYTSYENQLALLNSVGGVSGKVKPLSIDREMTVQDFFQLNQNVAKSVTQNHFNYFRQCIRNASRICTKVSKQRDSDLYEALLFDLFSNGIAPSKSMKCTPIASTTNESIALVCILTPNPSKVKAFRAYMLSSSDSKLVIPLQLWALEFIELIWTIFKKIYCLDVNVVYECNTTENMQFDCSKAIKTTMSILEKNSTCLWLLTGSIDMWTGRKYIGTQAFIRYQQLITKALMAERSKMSEFAIEFNVCLTIHSSNNGGTFELKFNHMDQTAKGDERAFGLQNFYNNFKYIIKSTRAKEKPRSEG